jgi:outer membrane protein TolC
MRFLPLAAAAALSSAALPAAAQEPLPLERAIGLALAESPELHRAEAARLQGRAQQADGIGRLLPSVSVFTDLRQIEELRRTTPDPITGTPVQLPDSLIQPRQTFRTDAGVSASWTVFSGGRRLLESSAARSRGRAALHQSEAVRVQLAADVTVAYLDALAADAMVEVRRAEVASAAALEETAEMRFEIGEVPEVDLLQARLAASEAEIALLEAEGEARIARLLLLERIGLPADRDYALAPPPAPGALHEDEIRRRAAAESPVLARLHAERAAAERERRASRLTLIPVVSLGVVWGRWDLGGSREAFTLDPQNASTSYRMTLSWSPLEQPGAIFADRDRATAGFLAADADAVAGRRTMERELAAGLDRLSRARALADRATLNVALAERQREHAEERYRLGLGTLVERLDAETRWAEAARQEIVARHAPLRAIAAIEQATGVSLR